MMSGAQLLVLKSLINITHLTGNCCAAPCRGCYSSVLLPLFLQCLEPPYEIPSNRSYHERCYCADSSPNIVVLEIEDAVDYRNENDCRYNNDSPSFTPIYHINSFCPTIGSIAMRTAPEWSCNCHYSGCRMPPAQRIYACTPCRYR